MKAIRIFPFVIFCFFTLEGFTKPLSPLDFGLKKAQTDIERYEVLLLTHTQAAKQNKAVSYKGIMQINIEIPKGGRSIPISYKTDFAGVKIVVRNNAKNLALFELRRDRYEMVLSTDKIIKGNFKDVNELRLGKKMVIIEDQTSWVVHRSGYNAGATRRDLLCLKNGKARNNVVATYEDGESNPKIFWCHAGGKQIVFKNLIFERANGSEFITNLFIIANTNNILVQNVKTITPSSTGLYGDCIMMYENCADIKVKDVTIDGTYSLKDKYGYGIGMNNVWNVSFVGLTASGNWGVFGNNNVSGAMLDDCDINRFDIHCYGRDVFCKNTTFRNLYNQFSSLYGTLRFEGCHFVNFVPVLFESSYSAYTHFNLEIENCVIDVDRESPYLISAGNPAKLSEKPRNALSKACWPDVSIRNLTVNLPEGINYWNMFQLRGGAGTKMFGITEIEIDGLIINGGADSPKVRVSNLKTDFDRQLSVTVRNSSIEKIEY